MSTKVLDPFEDFESLDAANEPNRPAGDDRDYIWLGQKLPRVTWYLGHCPGQHLLAYAGKTAALSAAFPLISAGLYTPGAQPPTRSLEYDEWDDLDMDELAGNETQIQLEKYVDSFAMRPVDQDEAIRMACDWADHMRAQYRYRDHKARIGSLAHYYKHDLAMGLTGAPTIDYLAALADQKVNWPSDVLERFARLGKSRDDCILDLAHHALPHARNVFDFVEAYKPEYEFIGLEAVVINRSCGYAGSLDELARYNRDRWRELNAGKWPFEPSLKSALLVGDLKTSNYLSNMTKFQIAAYRGAEFIALMADGTEHSVPETDGGIALHSKPDEGMRVTPYTAHLLDHAFEGFCALVEFVRCMQGMPRVSRGRKEKPAAKGDRDCPIFAGVK